MDEEIRERLEHLQILSRFITGFMHVDGCLMMRLGQAFECTDRLEVNPEDIAAKVEFEATWEGIAEIINHLRAKSGLADVMSRANVDSTEGQIFRVDCSAN